MGGLVAGKSLACTDGSVMTGPSSQKASSDVSRGEVSLELMYCSANKDAQALDCGEHEQPLPVSNRESFILGDMLR